MSKKESGYSKYAKYSGLGIQMGIIIAGLTWLGTFLDEKYLTRPLWTVLLSLGGVAISLYIVIKEVINMSKDKDEE
jgi:F0F1-type ATP synthase assembly protein I|tara:strand:- start:750 stop:977 length:228 start_codon:yes stop_codon:yes gene_type:complete